MKFTLESLDGREFTARIPRDPDAREHVVTLHSARNLRGVYEQDDTKIALDPVEADELLADIVWQLSNGSLRLAGPLKLGATSLDLDFARGDRKPSSTGKARSDALAVPILRVSQKDLEVHAGVEASGLNAVHDVTTDTWDLGLAELTARALTVVQPSATVRLDAIHARPIAAKLHAGAVTATSEKISLQGFSGTFGAVSVKAATATLNNLQLTRDAQGVMVIELASIELTGLEVGDAQRTGSGGAKITAFRYAPDGISFERLDVDEMTVAVEGLDAKKDEGDDEKDDDKKDDKKPPPELPFLDLLDGRIEAEIKVGLRVPVIQHINSNHTLKVDVERGAINYKSLERSLHLLEDAILDFEVKNRALVLELNAVVVKKPLVWWPLDDDGLARAREHHMIRLRTLMHPATTPSKASEHDKDDEGESAVGLQRVRVEGIHVELSLGGPSTFPMGAGALRLGAIDTPAIKMLRVRGAVEHETDGEPAPTELSLEAAAIDLGAQSLPLGDNRLDLGRLTLSMLTDATVTFRDVKPSAVKATLQDLAVRAFHLHTPPKSN